LLPGLPVRLRRLLIRDEAVAHEAAGDGAGVPVIVQQDFPVYYVAAFPMISVSGAGAAADRTSQIVRHLRQLRPCCLRVEHFSVGEYTFTERVASAKAPNARPARRSASAPPAPASPRWQGGRAASCAFSRRIRHSGARSALRSVLRSSATRRRIRHCLSRVHT
jgi:hypothetical protein